MSVDGVLESRLKLYLIQSGNSHEDFGGYSASNCFFTSPLSARDEGFLARLLRICSLTLFRMVRCDPNGSHGGFRYLMSPWLMKSSIWARIYLLKNFGEKLYNGDTIQWFDYGPIGLDTRGCRVCSAHGNGMVCLCPDNNRSDGLTESGSMVLNYWEPSSSHSRLGLAGTSTA